MKRLSYVIATFVMLAPLLANALAQEDKTKAAPKPGSLPAAKANPTPNATGGGVSIPDYPVANAPSPDEQAIRKLSEVYVKAFNDHNAKATSDLYTSDAEYIDEDGSLTQGRQSIEEGLKTFFTKNPECHLEINLQSVRVIAPNVAIEDGLTIIKAAKESAPSTTRYTAVHSKSSGKWLLASVRDSAVPQETEAQSRLSQFEWMLGEWIHQGSDGSVLFACYPIANGNYLVRDFSIQFTGGEAISGSQRIGWDAQAGKFKSWIFDSDGGYSEGYWHRDGDAWVLKSHGVTAKGLSASSTSVYAIENAHTMSFQTVDHEVAGHELPDEPKVKIVKRPPRPE